MATATKKHNWVTNSKIVDPTTDKIAQTFIGWCGHLTPEREAELDNLIGIGTPETNATPDEEYGVSEFDDDWMDAEPTAEDLKNVEKAD